MASRDSRNRRRFTLACASSLVLLSLNACADDEPVKGQLVLALQTDLALPKDIDTIRIQVRANGVSRFDRSYPFGGANENKIPATLTLVGGDDPKQSIEVRVLAFRQGEIRTLSKTITTIPEERTAMLRVPIQWFCYRQAEASGDDEFRSTCEVENGPDSACLGGECVDAIVAANQLPDFEPEVVFGGGESASDPDAACFSTEACFDAGFDVVPDEHCVVELPDGAAERLNFAVVTAMAGMCSTTTGACYVPLDHTAELGGWSELSAGGGAGELRRYALPTAVCQRLADGRGLRVRATRACAAKTASRPTCGEWSSVTAPADEVGAAGASGVAGAGSGEGGAAGETGGVAGGEGGAAGELGGMVTGGTSGEGGAGGTAGGGTSQGGSDARGGNSGQGGTSGQGGSSGRGGTSGQGGTAGSGGAGGAAAAGGTGGGSGGGPQAFCVGSSEFALAIDDLEDANSTILAPRDGVWFVYSDGSSLDLTPAVGAFEPALGEGAASMYGAALAGSGFTEYGAGLGFTLDMDGDRICTYDGQQYSALEFEYRSDTPLDLLVLDEHHTEPVCSGTCFGNAFALPASASFITLEVPFDDLDLGAPEAELDRARLTQVRFQAPAGTAFDFAVDNLVFKQVIGQ